MADLNPLVSIGMPVYNGEKYIRRALDSLLAQDYENFELNISDNASTDGTWQICQEYAMKDARIKLNLNENDLGMLANFGVVLEKACGKYFMWAACDDFWAPGFVNAMVNELETHPDSSVSMCAIERIRESGTTMSVVRYVGAKDPSRMGSFRLAMAVAYGPPYTFYIYGLYRTDFLRRAFHNFPRVRACDQLFVCQVALATRFRYVDQILHVRQQSDLPIILRYKLRYGNDEFSRILADPLALEKMVLAAGPYLYRSNVIPTYRKLWIPIIVLRFAVRVLGIRLYSLVYKISGRFIGPERRKAVSRLILSMLGKKPRDIVVK